VVAPTGTGKSVTIAQLVAEFCRQAFGRALVMTHTDEIGTQNASKIKAASPGLDVGRVQARANDVRSRVIVGSVPTLMREPRAGQIENVGLIIVDEAHHSAAPSWRQVLDQFGAFRGVPTVGFSATLARNDSRGLGEIWQEIVWQRDILWFIQRGYLVDVRGKLIQVPAMNLDGIGNLESDAGQQLVGQAMLNADAGPHIAKAYGEHAPDRSGLIFGPSIDAAHNFSEELNSTGIETEVVIGTTSLSQREATYDRFRAGDTQVISSCGVLTEGFDMPEASCAVIARPTHSPSLYVQMVGRILRPARDS